MRTSRSRSAGVDRRSALKVAAGAGIAAAGGVALTSRKARAATTLTIWTGFPELVPYYKSVAEAYAKVKPDVTVNLLSSSLREMTLLPTRYSPSSSLARFDVTNAGTPSLM